LLGVEALEEGLGSPAHLDGRITGEGEGCGQEGGGESKMCFHGWWVDTGSWSGCFLKRKPDFEE
jgi:hypothetical protein